MLDRFQYILANDAERHLETNEPLWDAMREHNEKYYLESLVDWADLIPDRKYTEKEKGMTVEEFLEVCTDEEREQINDAIADSDLPDIYQTFIIDKDGFDILTDYGEIVWYNEEMDLYFWGVTHYGTAWSHVMDTIYPIQNKEYYTV